MLSRVRHWIFILLLISPASQAASLLHYPEFLRFHTIFENQAPGAHGHVHDVDYLDLVMPSENALMTEERQAGLPIASSGVLIALEAPRFIETKLLLLADSAYFSFLIQLRGIEPEEATKMSRGAANAFRELMSFLSKPEFLTGIGNEGPQFVAAFGNSGRAFIRERLPALTPLQLDQFGESLDYLQTRLADWRKSYVASADLGTHQPCIYTLRPRSPTPPPARTAIRVTRPITE